MGMTSTERSHKRRARLYRERDVRIAAEKEVRKAKLAAARASKGLSPAKSSTERARDCRARQAAAEASRWYAPAISRQEAEEFIRSPQPKADDMAIVTVVEQCNRECNRFELHLNRFTLEPGGVAAAREARGALEQCDGDVEKARAQADKIVFEDGCIPRCVREPRSIY
jgi:hypothetical protein